MRMLKVSGLETTSTDAGIYSSVSAFHQFLRVKIGPVFWVVDLLSSLKMPTTVNPPDFIHLPYMLGKNLDSILEEYPKILLQLGESNLDAHILLLNILAQMMVNLKLSPRHSPKMLDGELFCYETETKGNAGLESKIHFAENELLLYFGEFEALAARDIEMGDHYAKSNPL